MLPQTQLVSFIDTVEEETDEFALLTSGCNDVYHELSYEMIEICASEYRKNLCLSRKAASIGYKPNIAHREEV